MQKSASSNRINYIDYLRGWAVLLMIFWHMIDALLSSQAKSEGYFNIAKFLGGLVAPTFLFTAGAAFSIILSKRKEAILKMQKPAIKQLFRILQIFLIAYLLHFNFKYLFNPSGMTEDEYLIFIQSDILHVIAIGLFFLILLLIICRKEIYFYALLIILTILIIFSTPYIYEIEFIKYFPIYIATFFNKKFNSLFPLFPWLSYLLLGALTMKLLLDYNKKQKEPIFIKILLYIGMFFILLGVIPEFLSIQSNAYYNFWLTSPNIFLIRIGVVFCGINLFRYISHKYNYTMKYFGIFGYESLFIYVLHLLLVYGKESPISLSHYISNSLGWIEFLAVYFVFIIFILFITKGYHFLKTIRRENIKPNP